MVPFDAVLLVAVALALAVAFRGSLMPFWLLNTLRLIAYPMILIGIVIIAFSLVDVYMVRIVRVPPGEPMGLDELAYPVSAALVDIARGLGLLVLAFYFRDYARRRKLSTGR